jgi:hypothetical protein
MEVAGVNPSSGKQSTEDPEVSGRCRSALILLERFERIVEETEDRSMKAGRPVEG